jgi:hypothetical protein
MVSDQNSLGFYYRPDDLHYSQADLHNWLSVLKSLQIRWLVLRARIDRAIPDAFIQGLQLAGIEPIVHIPATMHSLPLESIESQLAGYANLGIQHTVIGDRPNLREMWKASDWARGGLVEQFIDRFMPVWNAQRRHGFRPFFPALEPGGDYWDTAFLQSCLNSLRRRSQEDLVKEMVLGVYAWTFGKPLDWGAGGPGSWPEAKPYITPEGSQDHLGARIVDWYHEICRSTVGMPLDIFVLAGGVNPEARTEMTADQQADIHTNLAKAVLMSKYTQNLIGFCFYSLTAGSDQHLVGWYDKNLAASQSAESLERVMLAVPEPKSVSSPIKPIAHYILLPAHSDRNVSTDWKNIEPLVMALKPAVGFSVEEARLARQVIMIGNEELISSDCERTLRNQGCKVRRLAAPNSDEILLAASEYAAQHPSTIGADHV